MLLSGQKDCLGMLPGTILTSHIQRASVICQRREKTCRARIEDSALKIVQALSVIRRSYFSWRRYWNALRKSSDSLLIYVFLLWVWASLFVPPCSLSGSWFLCSCVNFVAIHRETHLSVCSVQSTCVLSTNLSTTLLGFHKAVTLRFHVNSFSTFNVMILSLILW